ncbi:MAG: HTH domain-containing protein, partial [Pseudomonadota bacterium]
MGDEKFFGDLSGSVRVLMQDVSEKLDERAAQYRAETPMRPVRPSDARVAALVARRPRGLPEIAERLGISRQAAHRSIQRLQEMGAKIQLFLDFSPHHLDHRSFACYFLSSHSCLDVKN